MNDERIATLEARLDRLDSEHVSIVKVLLEGLDRNTGRMDAVEGALRNIGTLLTGIQQGLAQQPRRVGTEELHHVLAADRTRVRAVEEQYDELRRIVVETYDSTKGILATTQQLIALIKGERGPDAE
jgi:hypothetical protein